MPNMCGSMSRRPTADVVSVDYYPFAVSKEAAWWKTTVADMGCVRKYAKAADARSGSTSSKWDFPKSDDEGGIGMTYEKLAVQTYAALAYGVKQLSYFTSSSLVSVTTDAKGPLYEEVKRLNRKMMHLGTFLLHKESGVLCHTGLSEELCRPIFWTGRRISPLCAKCPAAHRWHLHRRHRHQISDAVQQGF